MALKPEDRYAHAAGPGRRHRALDGRRAGLGLARAALAQGTVLGEEAPHGGDGLGGGRAVALAGTATVLVVQTQAKHALATTNGQLTNANDQLQRVQRPRGRGPARAQGFDLAKKAIEAYYTGASEDVLLKQPELEGLRNRLLRTALDFYRELGADLDADSEAGFDAKAAASCRPGGFPRRHDYRGNRQTRRRHGGLPTGARGPPRDGPA